MICVRKPSSASVWLRNERDISKVAFDFIFIMKLYMGENVDYLNQYSISSKISMHRVLTF